MKRLILAFFILSTTMFMASCTVQSTTIERNPNWVGYNPHWGPGWGPAWRPGWRHRHPGWWNRPGVRRNDVWVSF